MVIEANANESSGEIDCKRFYLLVIEILQSVSCFFSRHFRERLAE